jgi:lincosamide nucleotidyltransferase A/C/D/E
MGRLCLMEINDVLDVMDLFAREQVCCWIDGGWGVDALVGRETRPHADLDLVIARPDLASAVALLEAQGYRVTRDWLPTAIALRDASERQVDLHPVDPTPDGGGDQTLLDGSAWHYGGPVAGVIGGRRVPCCSAAEQLVMHVGYEPRPSDVHDVRLLASTYGLPFPEPYRSL